MKITWHEERIYLAKFQFFAIYNAMEQGTGLHNTFHSLQNGKMVRNIVDEWRKASPDDGFSRERKVNSDRAVLGVASVASSGFAYPRAGGGFVPSVQNGPQHQEDNRETSFNHASEADET